MSRSREVLLRRYLKRWGVTLDAYRQMLGCADSHPLEEFFDRNPHWTVGDWKLLIQENLRPLRRAASLGSVASRLRPE